MPQRNTGTETTPHPDGEKESIINDSEGKQIGMSSAMHRAEFTSLTQINDEQMKRFEKLMRGKPTSDNQ